MFYAWSTVQFRLATFQALRGHVGFLAHALSRVGAESKERWARGSETRVALRLIALTVQGVYFCLGLIFFLDRV